MEQFKYQTKPAMNSWEKIIYRLLLWGGTALTVLFGLWWFDSSHIASNFSGFFHIYDYLLFTLVSYVVWYQVINELFYWFVAGNMKHPIHVDPVPGMKVAFLTAFVPGKEPYEILENTLSAMVACDYPHDTWLLDEGNDPKAKAICAKLGVLHFSRFGIAKYNQQSGTYKAKTKGGNYNSWFSEHGEKYEVMAQLDVDFVPQKNYLNRILGYFRDASVAFVGTPQIYGNTNNSWIVKGAAEQAYNFYGSVQKGLFGIDMSLFIGANHAVRVAAHNDIEGYAGHIVEDHLTGMKLYAKKWKSVYVPEILAIGEGPDTWEAYFSQQMRWAYGLIDILFRHSPRVFLKMKLRHIINYFLLQQYYFYGLAQVIGIGLLICYFLFGIEITPMKLDGLLLLYLPVLIFQQIFATWLQRFNIDPTKERGLFICGKILSWATWPIYFLAFVGALLNKKLTYAVTPKGKTQDSDANLRQFLPHFVLGSLTLTCVIFSMIFARYAAVLLFWAITNTIMMYSFFVLELSKKIRSIPTYAMAKYATFAISIIFISVGSFLVLKSILSDKIISAKETVAITVDSQIPISYTPPKQTIDYIVDEDDTLWSIAHDQLGSGYNWQNIENPNGGKLVRPGDIVYLPKALVVSR